MTPLALVPVMTSLCLGVADLAAMAAYEPGICGFSAAGECREGYISLMRDEELSLCNRRDCEVDSVTDTLRGTIISSTTP